MNAPSTTAALLASANVTRPNASPPQQRRNPSAFEHLIVGQHLKFNVLRHLEMHRYEVALGGQRHVLESRVALQTGAQIDAQVEAKGDQLELKYLGVAASGALPVALGEAGATIAARAETVDDPALMTRGGMFLQKLAQRVTSQDLDALYRVLSGALRDNPAAVATQQVLDLDQLADRDDMTASLANAFDTSTLDPTTGFASPTQDSGTDGHARDDAQRAQRLLNLQDEGSLAWRYGTLPLLVGGQLIELDLVMFRERQPQSPRGGLRRLVMTLDTTHFGRVRVEARAVDNRLIVTLSAGTADAVDTLAAYGADVRGALQQLGWSVDEVLYEIDAPHANAAQAVVQHVLSSGTVDREL